MRVILIIILLCSVFVVGDNQQESIQPVIKRDTIYQMNGDIIIYEKLVFIEK